MSSDFHSPPPCPQPLYGELSLIVHQAHSDRPSAAPSRTSASLERFSTGAAAGRERGQRLCGATRPGGRFPQQPGACVFSPAADRLATLAHLQARTPTRPW